MPIRNGIVHRHVDAATYFDQLESHITPEDLIAGDVYAVRLRNPNHQPTPFYTPADDDMLPARSVSFATDYLAKVVEAEPSRLWPLGRFGIYDVTLKPVTERLKEAAAAAEKKRFNELGLFSARIAFMNFVHSPVKHAPHGYILNIHSGLDEEIEEFLRSAPAPTSPPARPLAHV